MQNTWIYFFRISNLSLNFDSGTSPCLLISTKGAVRSILRGRCYELFWLRRRKIYTYSSNMYSVCSEDASLREKRQGHVDGSILTDSHSVLKWLTEICGKWCTESAKTSGPHTYESGVWSDYFQNVFRCQMWFNVLPTVQGVLARDGIAHLHLSEWEIDAAQPH